MVCRPAQLFQCATEAAECFQETLVRGLRRGRRDWLARRWVVGAEPGVGNDLWAGSIVEGHDAARVIHYADALVRRVVNQGLTQLMDATL